jgi:hypothetical protein
LSSGLGEFARGNQDMEDLTSNVILGGLVPCQARDDYPPESVIGLSVASAVEPVTARDLAGDAGSRATPQR